jgi:hypothetical protein
MRNPSGNSRTALWVGGWLLVLGVAGLTAAPPREASAVADEVR